MKKYVVLFLAIGILSFEGIAQNSKVTSGVIAYDNGRYDEAIEKLETALANKGELKEKLVPKAHYYLAQAYLQAANDSALVAKYGDPAMKAYDQYQMTKESDVNGKFKNQLTLVETNLWPAMFNAGASAYNTDEYAKSKDLFEKAIELSPEDYNSYLMLGFSNWMLQDSMEAANVLRKSIDIYKGIEDKEDVPQFAQAYLMIATAQNGAGQTKEALATLAEASEMYPTDKNISLTELDIYSKNPDLAEEALKKFESAVAADPDNVNLKLAYADMLGKNGKEEKSEAMFKEILQLQPENMNANIQLGAKYINQAAVLSQSKAKLTKIDEIDAVDEQIRGLMRKAEPYIQKLHDMEPEQLEWISQLVSIGYILDYPEDKLKVLEEKQLEISAKARANQ
ncbi:MAG: tetratricopeptide repeat protein [Bacteroidota bacterium]